MRHLLLILIIAGIASSAYADPLKLESKSFLIEFPDTWQIVELSDKAKLRGPNNEALTISAIRITGFKIASGGSEDDWRRSRKEFSEHVVSRMHKASKSSDLKMTLPLSESDSVSGFPVWEIHTETTDGLRYFNLYGAAGLKVVLYITLDGQIDDKATSSEVINAIRNIEWK